MNRVFAPSPNRDIGRQVDNELLNLWGATSASPRDHLEFGAKLLGFAGEVADYGAVPDRLVAPVPQPRIGQVASSSRRVSPSAITLDTLYVSRAAKPNLGGHGSRQIPPPRDSIESQQHIVKRIGFISAVIALATTAIGLTWIARSLPQAGLDSTGPMLALLLPALHGLFFFGFTAAHGELSGATRRAKKYMAQVYPPSWSGPRDHDHSPTSPSMTS